MAATECAVTAAMEDVASHRWKVLAVGAAANTSFSAAAAGLPTTAVWMRSGYHLGNRELGLVLGAIGLGVAVSELPWGLLTDRFGDRPVLLSGLLGTAAALAAMAWFVVPSATAVPSLGWLVVAMCIVGLLGGSVNGSSGRAVMSWFKEGERGLAMSIRQTAVPLGGGIGALALPWLAANRGFAAVYGVLAAMCAITAIFAWKWLRDPPFETPAPAAQALNTAPLGSSTPTTPLTDTHIWRFVFGIAILCIPQFAVLTFATVFLHDFAKLGIGGISATMGAVQLGAMIMRVLSGRITDRLKNRRAYLRVSALVAAGSFAALALAAYASLEPSLLAAIIVVAGICVSAWHGVAYTELATMAGTARAGTALGMANTVVYAGLFATPFAIGHLLAMGTWTVVWSAGGACALLAYPLLPKPVAWVSKVSKR